MVASILFYLIAALIIFSALKMVMTRNLVHGTLFMALTFMGIAMIYLLLNADYIAIVQVMVYVGAISILFIFGVMLTKRENMEESSNFNRYKVYGGVAALALFAVLARIIVTFEFAKTEAKAADSTINAIASLLFNDYSIAFEIAGILMLVATIGAIVIGKGVKKSK